LPIIALTAHSMKGDHDRCIRAGMDDCLTKPFTQEDLRRMLARVPRISSAPDPHPLAPLAPLAQTDMMLP